jgi:hypothetical protein
MTIERTETALGATNGATGDSTHAGDPFAAQDTARTAELPLAGRTMMDLGRQVAALRALSRFEESERRKAEAERDRLRAEVTRLRAVIEAQGRDALFRAQTRPGATNLDQFGGKP